MLRGSWKERKKGETGEEKEEVEVGRRDKNNIDNSN